MRIQPLKLALDIPEVNNDSSIDCYLGILSDLILIAIDLDPIPAVRISDGDGFGSDIQNRVVGRYGKLLDADGVLCPAADGIDSVVEGHCF